MLDPTTPTGRFVSAALGLAAEKPWATVTLADIAERAGSSLVDLKAHFGSKGEILAAFSRLVDDEMLRRAPRRSDGQSPRDALFEVIMSRFDILDPWKPALKSIASSGMPDPRQVGQLYLAQGWMLEAAGIGSSGVDGNMRAAGLATVYASVFQTWLADDDPGLARTMAALDRRLRRGQRTLEQVAGMWNGLGRVGSAVFDAMRSGARAGAQPSTPQPESPVPPQQPAPQAGGS